jgi:hypothetical protein
LSKRHSPLALFVVRLWPTTPFSAAGGPRQGTAYAVPDDFARQQVDDVLRDIGGMIADALQLAA